MPHTIVVIDDDLAIVEIVCELLADEDMRPVPCRVAKEALACLHQAKPHLVLLDLQMPGLDGIDIFHLMRADPALTAVPVIFLTANAHLLRLRVPGYPAMAAALLPKPFHVVTLLTLIEQMLGPPPSTS